MGSLNVSQIDRILSLIDAQHSAHQISAITGYHTSTITRLWDKYCPDVLKPRGGRPSKLSSMDVHHSSALSTQVKLTTLPKSPECFVTSPIKTFHLKMSISS